MPVAILTHVPFESPGLIVPVLDRAGLEIRWLSIGETIAQADLPATDAVILMGGPMSANDPDLWVDTELDLIRRAIAANVPVLGICLGSQLIAKALGARVHPGPTKEIGWYPLLLTGAGREDPLLEGVPDGAFLFQWHGETFDIPAGAEWLARTETCPHQAFRYGRFVYALQFHPEVTPNMIDDWLAQEANSADVRGLPAPIDSHLHARAQQDLAEMIFGRWVERVVRR